MSARPDPASTPRHRAVHSTTLSDIPWRHNDKKSKCHKQRWKVWQSPLHVRVRICVQLCAYLCVFCVCVCVCVCVCLCKRGHSPWNFHYAFFATLFAFFPPFIFAFRDLFYPWQQSLQFLGGVCVGGGGPVSACFVIVLEVLHTACTSGD